jgi:tetratricopeptide (TPR) repeat protein
VLELTGRHEPARAELNRALDLVPAHHSISRARLLAHRAKTYQPEQKFEESLTDYARALQELGAERRPEDRAWWDAWLEANTGQIWALYLLNRPDDLEQLATRIAPVIDRVGNIRHRFGLVQTFLMVDYRQDRYTISDKALARARELVLVAEEMDHPTAFVSGVMGVSAARFHLAFCHLWRRELDQAAEQALAALADVERSGDTWLQTLCLTYLGVVERFRSDVEGTRHYARRAREVASSADMPFYVASANANLAWAALRAGRNDAEHTARILPQDADNFWFFDFVDEETHHYGMHWPKQGHSVRFDPRFVDPRGGAAAAVGVGGRGGVLTAPTFVCPADLQRHRAVRTWNGRRNAGGRGFKSHDRRSAGVLLCDWLR